MKHSGILAVAVAAFCIAFSPSAYSQDTKFTDQNVRELINESMQITKGSYADYVTAIKRDLHDDFRSYLDIAVYEGYGEPESLVLFLKKEHVILLTTFDIFERSFNHNKTAPQTLNIQEVKISQDGKSAQVKYDGTEMNHKTEVDDRGTMKLADSTYTCNDTLVLGKDNAPQLLSSYCTIKVTLKAEQDI